MCRKEKQNDSVVDRKTGLNHIVLGLFWQVTRRKENTAYPATRGKFTLFLLFDIMFNKIMLRMKCLKQKENVLADSSYKQQWFISCSIVSVVIVRLCQ